MSLGGFLGGGLTVDEFLATEFRQRCLVVRGNALDDLLPTTDILTLCEESSSDSIHVWLSKDGKIETIEVEDPKAAVLLYETAGAALYFRAPNSAEISILTVGIPSCDHSCRDKKIFDFFLHFLFYFFDFLVFGFYH